jgi:hypothetical protein
LQLKRAFLLAAALVAASAAWAHEFTLEALVSAFFKVEGKEAHLVIRAPLYLFKAIRFPVRGIEVDVEHSNEAMQRALDALQQGVVVTEDGRPLRASAASGRLALPSDRSFDTYDRATAHVAAPVEPDTRIVVDQGYVDAHIVYPIESQDAVFALATSAGKEIGTKLAIRFLGPHGEDRAVLVKSGSGRVELNPSLLGAASGFVALGIAHIATGLDHLLFLLCLVAPLRGVRPLLAIITGFTVAHSFTLIGSAFGLAPQGAWFPPFVEMAIAMSIVYMAIENVIGVSVTRRALLAIGFGLVHGFAFSQGLQEELQFAGSHLVTALFAFNIGIEIGQLLALAVMLPLVALVLRHVLPGRIGSIILALLIGHVGWHWMVDRWDALSRVRWPSLGVDDVMPVLLWSLGLVAAATAVRALLSRLRVEPSIASRAER